jgi:hypothetical protein
MPLNRALIDHDGHGEAGMLLRLGNDEGGSLIADVALSVPIDDDSVNAAADHVVNLPGYLLGIGGTVADIHVIRAPKPQYEVGVDGSGGVGVQQGMNVDLTDIAGAKIAIRL